MIENDQGFRVLVDPFNDAPEWSLGLSFPKVFAGKPMGANIVLMSEPDADHANAPGDWLENAPTTKPNSDPFPGLDLRGTVVYEWNGDVNIAYHYTVDGVRFMHLADNAHVLTAQQLQELGQPDILFISPPKTDSTDNAPRESVRKNISALSPKMVIWAHHLAPKGLPTDQGISAMRSFFVDFFRKNAATSKHYNNESSFLELCYILENALVLNNEYRGIVQHESSIEIDRNTLSVSKNTQSILFAVMLAKPTTEA